MLYAGRGAKDHFVAYVYADPSKPEGSRISIRFLRAGTYFPRKDPTDKMRVSGCELVEYVLLNDSLVEGAADSTKPFIRRQRWVKVNDPAHPDYTERDPADLEPQPIDFETFIQYESVILATKDWQDPAKAEIVKTVTPLVEITGITNLPMYHFRGRGEPDETWGVSLLVGMERLFLGLNQAATDEDMALAMSGLGVYVSNAKPVNANGEEIPWLIGPKRVIGLNGPKTELYFERVTGVSKDAIGASQEHVGYLHDQVDSTAGISDVALGQVDTAVAESGVALMLRMGPILDESDRIDDRVLSKLRHLFYDLRQWFSVYEGANFDDTTQVVPNVGPKLPPDIDKELARFQDMFVNGVIPLQMYLQKLIDLEILSGTPETIMAQLQKEADENLARQQAAMGGGAQPDGQDPAVGGDRLDAEADAEPAPVG